MVVILPVPTLPTGTEQERITWPSIWTEQAPHWAMPQPNLVPVMPSHSRITQSSGVSGSTSTWRVWPFTCNVIIAIVSCSLGPSVAIKRGGRQGCSVGGTGKELPA